MPRQESLLERIQVFESKLNREDFYDFYALVTAMASPQCGDRIYVDGKSYNLKKIVRRIRITTMFPRFNVDYAPAYNDLRASEELDSLMELRLKLPNASSEAAAVDKLIGALQVIVKSRQIDHNESLNTCS